MGRYERSAECDMLLYLFPQGARKVAPVAFHPCLPDSLAPTFQSRYSTDDRRFPVTGTPICEGVHAA